MYTIRVATNEMAHSKNAKGRPKMNPSIATASEPIKPQATLFDLDTMEEVTLYKVVEYTDVENTEQALARLGNNSDRLVAVINRGLRAELASDAKKNPSIPWMTENDNGDLVPFTGTPANSKNVKGLILTLAKQLFGYDKDSAIEKRRSAKDQALNFIKTTDVIRESFKKQAAEAVVEAE